jgi:signal transduction histidine kinase
MSFQKKSYHFSLTTKFFLWSLAIILFFALTAGSLFLKINSMEEVSSQIVQSHYKVVEISESLIDRILTTIEYKKRFLILDEPEDRIRFLDELRGIQKELQRYLDLSSVQDTMQSMSRARPSGVYAPHPAGGLDLTDQDADQWLDFFSAIRDDHRSKMARRLQDLEIKVEEASQIGLVGLVFSSSIVILGSLVMIVRISRSTRQLKVGLQRIGQKEGLEPIEVMSNDELGELSIMFNDMIERLKKEEQKRTDFISMLSHEIRTPLTSIGESLSLIQERLLGPVNEKQDQFLEVSRQEVERLTTLLNRLMLVTSLDGQLVHLEREPHNIKDELENCLNRVTPMAQSKGVELVLEDDTENATVLVDRENLQQVLLNLMGNAIKYSPEGSSVRMEARDGNEDGFAVITIRDQGPGIPDDERKFVFDTFYRGESVRKEIDGAGLGLSISMRIVKAHGGEMWLESNDDQSGCAFSFSLPKAEKS